ncbi:MAG: methyltransferase domain-containing protein [Verrucomicrobiales bacterium]|nr:methyltransferase domain-containing protein [Verrucomicrobiales bacterium]
MKYSFALLLLISFLPLALNSQEKSLKPGINDSFKDPSVEKFEQRFEKEGREVYDQREAIIKQLGLTPGMSVADIGSGTGLFTRLLAPAVGKTGKVYAVDIAKNFVEHSVASAKKAGWKNVIGVVCKADEASLPAASVDVVFICATYHHFEYPFKTMTSILRALRPGGKLVVVDFERIEGKSRDWLLKHVRADKALVTKEITASGFELIEEVPMFKENYLLKFKASAK